MKKQSLLGYYVLAFKKYAQFSGRASRSEFWSFFLLNTLVFSSLYFPSHFLGAFLDNHFWVGEFSLSHILTGLYWVCFLISFLPAISLGVRRLHDTGHSGWWLLSLYLLQIPYALCSKFFIDYASQVEISLLGAVLLLVLSILLSVGSIIWGVMIFVWYAKKSQPFPNRFGPVPESVLVALDEEAASTTEAGKLMKQEEQL